VICGTTLFRVHTSTLSFQSPVLHQIFSPANLAAAESPNGCPRIRTSDTPGDFATLLKTIYLPGWVSLPLIGYSLIHDYVFRFPQRNKVPDFTTFSSLLRVSTNYEMPNIRAQLLEIIYNAYPESFEGLDPSVTLGEGAFDGPEPHPNAVLNLFVQQNIRSALPMAYYMAARKGLDSLMDDRLPPNATLSGQTLRSAMRGLMALREMELKETHRIVFALKDTTTRTGCSSAYCPSRSSNGPLGTGNTEAHRRAFDRITGSGVEGTRILQVLSVSELIGDMEPKFCRACVEKVQVAHAEVRRKAWAALPVYLGLRA
jgi:hypothetical protein